MMKNSDELNYNQWRASFVLVGQMISTTPSEIAQARPKIYNAQSWKSFHHSFLTP